MRRVGPSITAGLQFIANEQRSDGGFAGLASADKDGFANSRVHPTIFFTALISQCCQQCAGSESVVQKSIDYLLAHRSPIWSWNYWQRDKLGAAMRGYPDDLDDTACAMAAIIGHDPSRLDGTVLGHIGRQLVSAEAEVGGPYQTWLVPPAALSTWYDIDVAVNANVAFLLSCADVMPPQLEHYLYDAIANEQLNSSYYLGTIPTLYFLARTGKRSYSKLLKVRIEQELREATDSRTPLMNALLLSAAARAGCKLQFLRPLTSAVLETQHDGHWAAHALYVEPAIAGVAYYAGSAALTTAFACEALALYESLVTYRRPTTTKKALPTLPPALQATEAFSHRIEQPDLRAQYTTSLRAIAHRDSDGQISAMAQHFSQDLGRGLSPKLLEHLDIASINGWLAYTSYDNFLDGEARASELGAANLALRECIKHFRLALPRSRLFTSFVQDTLNTVDNANTWESLYARSPIKKGVVIIQQLPDYNDLNQLAKRSWGHAIASTGVLLAAGYKLRGPKLQNWQLFFHHFLIARQLNDDAHDWPEDLAAGHLNAVVCILLQNYPLPLKIHLPRDIPLLRQYFWETAVDEVTVAITDHLVQAEAALDKCTFLQDRTRYYNWLTALGQVVETTITSRQEALAFMDSFNSTL